MVKLRCVLCCILCILLYQWCYSLSTSQVRRSVAGPSDTIHMHVTPRQSRIWTVLWHVPRTTWHGTHLAAELVGDGGAVLVVALQQLDLLVDPVHLAAQLLLPLLAALDAVAPHLVAQPPQRRVRLLQLDVRHLCNIVSSVTRSTLAVFVRNHNWQWERLTF